MIDETFWTLLRDRAHWEFELFLMALFDGLVGAALWPLIRKHWNHHIARDKREKFVDIRGTVPKPPLGVIWQRAADEFLRYTATKGEQTVDCIVVGGPNPDSFRVYEEMRNSMRNWDATIGIDFSSRCEALNFLIDRGWKLTEKNDQR